MHAIFNPACYFNGQIKRNKKCVKELEFKFTLLIGRFKF